MSDEKPAPKTKDQLWDELRNKSEAKSYVKTFNDKDLMRRVGWTSENPLPAYAALNVLKQHMNGTFSRLISRGTNQEADSLKSTLEWITITEDVLAKQVEKIDAVFKDTRYLPTKPGKYQKAFELAKLCFEITHYDKLYSSKSSPQSSSSSSNSTTDIEKDWVEVEVDIEAKQLQGSRFFSSNASDLPPYIKAPKPFSNGENEGEDDEALGGDLDCQTPENGKKNVNAKSLFGR